MSSPPAPRRAGRRGVGQAVYAATLDSDHWFVALVALLWIVGVMALIWGDLGPARR